MLLLQKTGLIGKPEATSVVVELLSGQRLEVGCRSDSTAGDVFDAVVHHQELHEHSLHGEIIGSSSKYRKFESAPMKVFCCIRFCCYNTFASTNPCHNT